MLVTCWFHFKLLQLMKPKTRAWVTTCFQCDVRKGGIFLFIKRKTQFFTFRSAKLYFDFHRLNLEHHPVWWLHCSCGLFQVLMSSMYFQLSTLETLISFITKINRQGLVWYPRVHPRERQPTRKTVVR